MERVRARILTAILCLVAVSPPSHRRKTTSDQPLKRSWWLKIVTMPVP